MKKFKASNIGSYFQYHTLIYLTIVCFVGELAYATINQSAIPPYLESIGLKAHTGMIIGMFLVVEALLKSPMGSLGDRLGRRPLIVGGAIISCVTAICITLIHQFYGLMILRAIDGIAAAAIWPTMMAAVSGSVPPEKRTMAMNATTVAYMVGIALGPFIGGLANDLSHSKLTSFYLVSFLFLTTALVAYFLTPHRSSEEMAAVHEYGEEKVKLSDILNGMKAFPDMMAIAFLAFFGVGIIIPIIKYFAMDELKLTETGYGVLVLPIALAVALASLLAGSLGDRLGKAKAVRIGVVLAAIGMWLAVFSSKAWMFMGAGMVLGIGFVIAMPSWLAFLSDMSAPRLRGTVIGSLGTAQGIGAVIGTVLGSILYAGNGVSLFGVDVSPHHLPLAVSATALSISVVLVLIFIRDNDGRKVGMAATDCRGEVR